jgi:signal transduction histidine kinase
MRVRELQQLAAAVAHEVRNPLNSMAIHVELLETRLRREGGSEAALKSTGVLAQEIERVDHILEEYLQFAGPPETQRQPVDPRALLAAARDRAAALASERGARIELRGDGELGSWLVDAEGLAEALDAITANALEASPAGGVVELEARTVGDLGEVVVRDQGEGIAEADLLHIFRIGFSRRGHAGIGLTVAKQIIKGHGGSIIVQRAQPRGTNVTIRLPVDSDQ